MEGTLAQKLGNWQQVVLDNLEAYAVFVIDLDGTILTWQPGVLNVLGYDEVSFVGQKLHLIYTEVDRDAGLPEQEMRIAQQTGRAQDERWHLKADGSLFWALSIVTPLYDDAGTLVGFTKIMRDSTQRKQEAVALQERESQLGFALEAGDLGTWSLDMRTGLLRFDARCRELLGVSKRMRYQEVLERVHPKDRADVWGAVRTALDPTSDNTFEVRFRPTAFYPPRWLLVQGKCDFEREGTAQQPRRFVGVMKDVTEQAKNEQMMEQLAYQDALTELANRFFFEKQAETLLALARRHRRKMHLIYIDLDGFKEVNDTQGHAAGDDLLVQVAQRFRARVRSSDLLGRLGGDEFVALVEGDVSARTVGERYLEPFAEPFDVQGRSVRIGASIGVAEYPEEGGTLEALMSSADMAMYEAKRSGGGVKVADLQLPEL